MSAADLSLWQRILMSLVRGYRFFLSPWLGSACRFEPTCSAYSFQSLEANKPTCSAYSLQAIETHGAGAGTYMTLHRLARCQPWCEGGHDPVPALPPALFRSFSAVVPAHPGAAISPSTDKTSP